MPSEEPEPSSRRSSPPPRLLTAVAGYDSPSDRVVVLDLLDNQELAAFTKAFELLKWRVAGLPGMLELLAIEEDHPDLVLTDDPMLPRNLPEEWKITPPPVVVVVDDRISAVEGAQNAGADGLVIRPVDYANPLGF